MGCRREAGVQLCAGIHRCAQTPYERGRQFVRLGRMSPITSSRALAAEGLGPNHLTRMVRNGGLIRLRRGAYADPGDGTLDTRAAHLRLLEAHAAALRPGGGGQPHLGGGRAPPPGLGRAPGAGARDAESRGRRAYASADPGTRRRPSRRRRDRRGRTPGHHRRPHGRRLSRTLSLVQAVAAGDAALNQVSRTEIEQVLAGQAGRTGIARARLAVAFLDPRSESAGESYSRVVLHRAGLPGPSFSTRSSGCTGYSWVVQTSGGRSSGCSGSSMGRRSMASCCDGRGRPRRTS